MARFLAYTSPATGHLFPLVPGLLELIARGHEVRLYGPAEHLDAVRAAGIDARDLDPRIAAVEVRDFEAETGAGRLRRALSGLMARGELDRAGLEVAIAHFDPDLLL